MFKIGEFSILSSISISMLRHYDKIGLLKPEYVDQESGYRYYTKKQLIDAGRIAGLKSMGFGLKEIEVMNTLENEALKRRLEEKYCDIQNQIKGLQAQMERIKAASYNIEKGEEAYDFNIVVKVIPEENIVSYRGKIKDFSEEGILWQNLTEEYKQYGIKIAQGSAMAVQHEVNYEEGYVDVEVQLPVLKLQKDVGRLKFYRLPERMVASFVYEGSYNKVSQIVNFLAEWITKNEYEVYDHMFFIYHHSPKDTKSEEEFITELCYPIRKK